MKRSTVPVDGASRARPDTPGVRRSSSVANRPAGPSTLAIWAGLLTVYIVWGSTYLGIRVAVETIPPFLMAAVRFLIAGTILYSISSRRGDTIGDRPGRRAWRDATIAGTLLLLGGMGLVAWGEQTVASGITALLIALMPMWLAVIGRMAFGQRLPVVVLGGIALGLVGVAILAWPSGSMQLDPVGLVAIIVSPISWAAGSLFVAQRAQLPRRGLVSTGMQMIAGGLVLAVVSVLTGEVGQVRLDRVSVDSVIALGYLIAIGSLLAFSVYGWLLRVAPLSLVGTYAYVNPIVAVVLGAVLLGEPITLQTIVAGAVIIVAVAVIVTARGRSMPGHAHASDAATRDRTAQTASSRTARRAGGRDRPEHARDIEPA